jgi:hypothetical protein
LWSSNFLGARYLEINLRSSDTQINKAFADWLVEQRTKSPLPLKKPGRKYTNIEVTHDHLESWTRYYVLAVLDLDFYAKIGEIKLSHERLYELLVSPDEEAKIMKDWGRAARKKAKEAMQCVDLLIDAANNKNRYTTSSHPRAMEQWQAVGAGRYEISPDPRAMEQWGTVRSMFQRTQRRQAANTRLHKS